MLHLVALRDTAASSYTPVMAVPNVNAFVRTLADEINRPDPQEIWAKHTEDFELYTFGLFDEVQGFFNIGEKPDLVCKLSVLVKS